VMSMPPYNFWLQGAEIMGQWFGGPGIACKDGAVRVTGGANGTLAVGTYRIDPEGGYTPWALQVLETSGGRIVGHHNFLDTNLFEVFGLPTHLS
jgi:RNA polymerase sigma-70 factor (ECF subfamily)